MGFWLATLVVGAIIGLFVWWDLRPLPKSIFEDGWEIVQKERLAEQKDREKEMIEQPEITSIVGSYGVPFRGVMMNRVAAEHYAQQLEGTVTSLDLFPSNKKFKIVKCYLDDLDGPNVGQIIAVCHPLQGVGPSEVK